MSGTATDDVSSSPLSWFKAPSAKDLEEEVHIEKYLYACGLFAQVVAGSWIQAWYIGWI